MKAISLWQPWASLVALGEKKHETRSWPTRYRGPIAIHASKKWNIHLKRLCLTAPFTDALGWANTGESLRLPLGCIVATAELVDCVEISAATMPSCPKERAFGDYTPGRFRWDLANVTALACPISIRGYQGIFETSLSLEQIERLAAP